MYVCLGPYLAVIRAFHCSVNPSGAYTMPGIEPVSEECKISRVLVIK